MFKVGDRVIETGGQDQGIIQSDFNSSQGVLWWVTWLTGCCAGDRLLSHSKDIQLLKNPEDTKELEAIKLLESLGYTVQK